MGAVWGVLRRFWQVLVGVLAAVPVVVWAWRAVRQARAAALEAQLKAAQEALRHTPQHTTGTPTWVPWVAGVGGVVLGGLVTWAALAATR